MNPVRHNRVKHRQTRRETQRDTQSDPHRDSHRDSHRETNVTAHPYASKSDNHMSTKLQSPCKTQTHFRQVRITPSSQQQKRTEVIQIYIKHSHLQARSRRRRRINRNKRSSNSRSNISRNSPKLLPYIQRKHFHLSPSDCVLAFLKNLCY